ncbi:MAG: class I SAM-dependent methyltransferase [Planctomycetota bacterium]
MQQIENSAAEGVMTRLENGYELIDSGQQMKLERFGPYVLARPAAQAVWAQSAASAWRGADATFTRESSGTGTWEFQRTLPLEWDMNSCGLTWRLRRNDFGHVGIFPEQEPCWRWIREQVQHARGASEVLNLFGYTGGSTLSAAAAGARVVHLDASKTSVKAARDNAELSGLAERPIRWIVEDAVRFVDRELRRERRYSGIVLDPPSYGRGARGETWKIEDDMLPFLEKCCRLLDTGPAFVLLSSHSPGFTPIVLANLLAGFLDGPIESGEMVVHEASGRPLPAGAYARWRRVP